MAELIILGGLFLLVSVVLPIYLLIAMGNMKRRLELLESRFDVRAVEIPEPQRQPQIEQPPAPEPEPEAEAEPEPVPEPAPEPKPQYVSAFAGGSIPKVRKERPPRNFVFSPKRIARLVKWAQENWVFILAGVSLALAGVFLVQYGVEHGLLSPTMRVLSAIGFGGLLVGAGEFVRRKSSGDEAGSFALLPSVFAGAGLVAIFAGVLSARMLYGLIGPQTAFVGLALTGALAVLLGWFYGPLLATLGVFGALLAPFLVGGNSDNAGLLHLYFALIAAIALLIDAYKRWAWLSALALIGAFGASWLLLQNRDTGFYAMMFAFITAILATGLPMLSLSPRHSGDPVSSYFTKSISQAHPGFPTRLAAGAFITASLYIGLIYSGSPALFWLALMVLGLLVFAAVFWMKDAPALADLAFVPPLVALYIITTEAMGRHAVMQEWLADTAREQLDSASPIVMFLLAGALATSLAFAWRSYFLRPMRVANAVMAAGFAPWVAILIDIRWNASQVLGPETWAMYLAVIAVAMVLLTERFARIDTPDRTRTALFALSSMSMISFMLVVVLGDIALTLSLAVMALAAAWLGKRFNLRLLDYYIHAGVAVLSYRLVIDPGLLWGFDAPLWQPVLAFVGVIALLSAAWFIRRAERIAVPVVLESAVWTFTGIFSNLMLARWMDAMHRDERGYVLLSLGGLVWLVLAANQLYRLKAGGRLVLLRIALSAVYGLIATGMLAAVAVMNPAVVRDWQAFGWVVFGGLGAAYLLPALVLAVMAWRLNHLRRRLRMALVVFASLFAALFVALEIRHFWQGDHMTANNILKPELYTYTVAMIITAIALLALAFVRQSPGLRRLALVMVALVVLKVFFVDMSELDGLLRVASFLVLGLVAALMAWVNRLLKANEAGKTPLDDGT